MVADNEDNKEEPISLEAKFAALTPEQQLAVLNGKPYKKKGGGGGGGGDSQYGKRRDETLQASRHEPAGLTVRCVWLAVRAGGPDKNGRWKNADPPTGVLGDMMKEMPWRQAQRKAKAEWEESNGGGGGGGGGKKKAWQPPKKAAEPKDDGKSDGGGGKKKSWLGRNRSRSRDKEDEKSEQEGGKGVSHEAGGFGTRAASRS